MTRNEHSSSPAGHSLREIEVSLVVAITPKPTIRPSTVSRAFVRSAIADDARLEIGIDPVTREPALRIVDNNVTAFCGTPDDARVPQAS